LARQRSERSTMQNYLNDIRIYNTRQATVNEELHLATLKNLAFAFAHVLDTGSLCRYLEGNFK